LITLLCPPIAPLGLGNDIMVGVPKEVQARRADTYARRSRVTTPPSFAPLVCRTAAVSPRRAAWQRSTRCCWARDGSGNVRLFSPRLIAYVSRNHTGRARRRTDERDSDASRPWAARARRERPHPRTLHDRRAGDVRTWRRRFVVLWADPESGVSFTYLTNYVVPDPWHSARLDRVANLVHAAID
jgi:hypothetical protein